METEYIFHRNDTYYPQAGRTTPLPITHQLRTFIEVVCTPIPCESNIKRFALSPG